jgi:hypothetical protein
MSLRIEEKIKSWLVIVSKVLVIGFILVKGYDYLFQSKPGEAAGPTVVGTTDSVPSEPLKDKTRDSLVKNPETNRITEPVLSPKRKTDQTKVVTPPNNALDIFIFEEEKLNQSVVQKLGKTYFDTYSITPISINVAAMSWGQKRAMLRGNFSAIAKQSLSKVALLCTGTVAFTYRGNKENPRSITCDMHLNYNVFDVVSGEMRSGLSEDIWLPGFGFSETQARTDALEKLDAYFANL